MKPVHYKHAERTGLTKAEIRRRAEAYRKAAPFRVTMQDAVDAVIDAAIEHAAP